MNKLGHLIYLFIFRYFKRDFLKYISDNTYNSVTKRFFPFFWTYQNKILVTALSQSEEKLKVFFLPNQFWKENHEESFLEIPHFSTHRIPYHKTDRKYFFELASTHQISIGEQFQVEGPFQKDLLSQTTETIVYFKHLNKEVRIPTASLPKSILDIGIEAGINLERGCQKGICGTCKLVLHEGEIKGKSTGKVIYCCKSFPASQKVYIGA